jgi:prepilin-type N-terminal cleavage/methylation domain-containing protein|tara:strand:- start:713 stop:1342 length:630 start_codon:yes stop_codon:yes gene_type:complete
MKMIAKVSRWSPGLTLIELVTTIVILGIIMVGLGLSLRTVTHHYQDDSVLLEVHNYGNAVMREIMKEISLARIINKEQINGYSRISLKKYDTFGNETSTVITANASEGILFNYQNPLDGNLRFPTKGRFRNNNQRIIMLKDFYAEEVEFIRPNLARYANSTWEINMDIEVESFVSTGGSIKELVQFQRVAFMPNRYISPRSLISNQVGS